MIATEIMSTGPRRMKVPIPEGTVCYEPSEDEGQQSKFGVRYIRVSESGRQASLEEPDDACMSITYSYGDYTMYDLKVYVDATDITSNDLNTIGDTVNTFFSERSQFESLPHIVSPVLQLQEILRNPMRARIQYAITHSPLDGQIHEAIVNLGILTENLVASRPALLARMITTLATLERIGVTCLKKDWDIVDVTPSLAAYRRLAGMGC